MPLDLGVAVIRSLQADTADRQRVRHRDDEAAAGPAHILGIGVARQRDVKALFEAATELGVIFPKAIARLVAARIHLGERDTIARQRRRNQIHRREQRLGLRIAGEKALGLRIRQRLIGREFALAGTGQAGDAAARIVLMRLRLDQAFIFQAAQQPAHQPGIEAEIVADLADVGASVSDRIEHARRAQRPAAPEE